MSEFLAEASVLVLPDTTKFRALLLKELEADTLAVSKTTAAKVVISPSLVGFRKKLAAELGVATEGVPAPVLVEPDLTGFRALLASLTQTVADTVTANVRVVPDFTGFALALERGVNAIAKTVPATVPVVPAAVPAAAAVTGGGGAAQIAAGASQVRARAAQSATAEAAALRAVSSAEEILVLQQKREVAIVGEAAVARSRYAAAVRASAILQQQANELTAASNPLLVGVIELEAAYARNLEITAKAELEAAIASQTRTAALDAERLRQSQAIKGAAATGLAAAGARGATLAASGPFLAGAAAAVALGKSIQIAAKFDQQLSVLQVTAGATAEQMNAVADAARKLGADVSLPAVSASDAAEAMTELSKAGLSVEDSLAGARGVLQLAAAAQIDNAQATELAASALNAFGLAGGQAVHVADVLANAANDAQGSIVDIGIALQQASAVGRQAGLSLEQVSAVLTLFARNGLRGSDAGTSFRTMIIRLINPTAKAAEVIKKLGLRIRDSSGAINLDVFDQFTAATKNFTKAERDRDLAIIFGQDAIRGAAIAAREGKAGLDAEIDSLNKSGTAAQVAGARARGLAGEASALGSNLETLALNIGHVLNPALEGLVRDTNFVVSAFNRGADAARGLISAIGGIGEFDASSAHLGELVTQLGKVSDERQKFLDTGGKGAPKLDADIADLQKRLADIGKSLVAVGPAGVQKFVAAFTDASPQIRKALADGVITPLENAQLSSTDLGKAFVANLPKRFFSGLGAAIRSDLEDAGAAAKAGAADTGAEIASGIEDASRQAVVAARTLGVDVGKSLGDSLKSGVGAAFFAAVNAVNAGARAMDDALNQLTIAGAGPKSFINVLQTDFARQQKAIDAADARLAELQSKGDSPAVKRARAKAKAARSAALQQQAQDTQNIKAQNDQLVSDAQQAAADRTAAAQKVKDANTKADQAVIDSFAGQQNRIDLAQIRASSTQRLSDDIAVQNIIIATAKAEIAQINLTVKNQQTANREIAARVKIIAAARTERDRLVAEAADQATENARTARQATTDLLGKRLQLAQLVGGKDPILAAFNKAISDARLRVKHAKKLGLVLVDERIALQTLINDRKDFLDGLKKDAKEVDKSTVSAFSLLTEFNAKFNDIAGNLVTSDQPFADSSAFSTDIVNKAVASIKAPTSRPTLDAGIAKGADATDRNTQAITALTDAILRSTGNTAASDGKPGKGPSTISRWGAGAWWNASHFREARDG